MNLKINSFMKIMDNFGIESIDELYYPNMCHICRCFGPDANLKRCGACGMISYCCQEHQRKDWPSHKQFCKAICQIKKEWNVNSIFERLKNIAEKIPLGICKIEELNSFLDFIIIYLMFSVQLSLQNELKPIEIQMIEFPRVCAICFESNSALLTNCEKCPLTSFCKKHLNDPSHESQCTKILSSYNFNTQKKSIDPTSSLLSKIADNRDHYVTFSDLEVKQLPSSLPQFIEEHFLVCLDKFGISNIEITEKMKLLFHNVLSERYSVPFTILFAVEKLSLKLNSMVIHVVGASEMEQRQLIDWEIIFHFLPQLRQLRLVLIGPELLHYSRNIVKQLCNVCEKEERKLIIETKKELYHEYCREDNFLKPDMIACFNPGFYAHDTWKKSIQVFDKGQCPLLVTTQHKTEASIDNNFINSKFPSAKCIYNDYNPFTCPKYQRSAIFLPMAAVNEFMFLYEFLHCKSM